MLTCAGLSCFYEFRFDLKPFHQFSAQTTDGGGGRGGGAAVIISTTELYDFSPMAKATFTGSFVYVCFFSALSCFVVLSFIAPLHLSI